MDEAARRFCEQVFQMEDEGRLELITTRSWLGIAPISDTFCYHWNRSFFNVALSKGPMFMRRLEEQYTKSWLPDWVLAISFAVRAKFKISFLVADGEKLDEDLFSEPRMRPAERLLKRYTSQQPVLSIAEQTSKWKQHRREFDESMTEAIEVLMEVNLLGRPRHRLLTNGDDPWANAPLPLEQRLCVELFKATKAAGQAITTNKDTLSAFLGERRSARIDIASSSVSAGLLGIGSLGSAITMHETIASGAATLSVVGGPLFASVAGLGLAVGSVALLIKSVEKKEKCTKQIAYHRAMELVAEKAFMVSWQTDKFLQMISLPGLRELEDADFVDDTARQTWAVFVESIKNILLEMPSIAHAKRARYVLTYLDAQRRGLMQAHAEMKEQGRALEEKKKKKK